MSHNFLIMLKHMAANFDRIAKELNGYAFRVEKHGKKAVEVAVAPDKEPHFKQSSTMTDIILQFYPQAALQRTAAASLLKIWTQEVETSRNSNLRTFTQMYGLLQPLLKVFYQNEGSLASKVTAWRRPIREKFGDKNEIYIKSVHDLGISRERSLARRAEYADRVRASAARRVDSSVTQDRVLSVIREASQSGNILANIVAVLLATGARLVECLKVSQFEAVSGHPELIRVLGVAKDTSGSVKDIVRPLIELNSHEVIDLVKRIRQYQDFANMTNDQASNKMAYAVNKVVNEYFDGMTAHKMRYIWASMAYQLHGGREPEQEWIRRMLGHESADTSLTYTQIVVGSPIGAKKNNGGEEVPRLEFPELENPRHVRLGHEKQLVLLRQLDAAFGEAGRHMTQADVKRYRFGSAIIQKFWSER